MMEAAAPQQVVVVQAAGKSALPKVIGIIAMVLGIIGVIMQVLIGGLLGILGAAAADAGADVNFLELYGWLIFSLPSSILLIVGGVKTMKYQMMGVYMLLGAELLNIISNFVVAGDGVVGALMFPVIWGIVWALPMMASKADME
jgi:hypothetical protein